jgi:hypothetical protein
MVWAMRVLFSALLLNTIVSLSGVTETLVESVNRYRGQTITYRYAPGDPDYEQSGLENETVFEDARGFPAFIELSYVNGVTAGTTTYDDGRIKTIDYRFPDHREIDYYDMRQFLTRTEVIVADTLRETSYFDDSLRVTSSVSNLRDGRQVTRYYDEKQICRYTETVYPDGRKESRQTDEADQERLQSTDPKGKGRVEIRPIPSTK